MIERLRHYGKRAASSRRSIYVTRQTQLGAATCNCKCIERLECELGCASLAVLFSVDQLCPAWIVGKSILHTL